MGWHYHPEQIHNWATEKLADGPASAAKSDLASLQAHIAFCFSFNTYCESVCDSEPSSADCSGQLRMTTFHVYVLCSCSTYVYIDHNAYVMLAMMQSLYCKIVHDSRTFSYL